MSGAARTTTVVLVSLAVLAALIPRWITIFTESINWDEFALLYRVERSLRAGHLFGGGRPGLVSLVLMPLVRDCVDSVTTAVRARVFWQFITLAYLLGVFALVRSWFRFSGRPERGVLEGLTAVALLAFLPAFVAWSVQVRTDQAALAAATLGGAFLLSDRRAHALVAGTLFGIAVLCTQKGAYVIGLAGALWLSATIARAHALPSEQRKSEILRRLYQSTLVAGSGMTTIFAYLALTPADISFASERAISSNWNTMLRVREIVGFRAYATAAKQALVHGLLLLGLLIAGLRAAMHRRWLDGHLLVTCWLVLLLGCLVALVHGSSWAYFIMTLGLFVAVALGLSVGHLAQALGRSRPLVLGLLLVALVLGSVQTTAEMLQGHQSNQRESLGWIRSSGLRAHRGYQVDGALVCMADPDPIRPMSHRLNMGPLSPEETSAFVNEFRSKQVAYVIDLGSLGYFPSEVLEFWSAHYLWHFGAVWVAGFSVSDGPHPQSVDVIAPGRYRWLPMPPHRDAQLVVSGVTLAPGSQIWLETGQHSLMVEPATATGNLVLDIESHPDPRIYAFMDWRQRERLGGAR